MNKHIFLLISIFFLFQSCDKIETINEVENATSHKLTSQEADAINEFINSKPLYLRYEDNKGKMVDFNIKTGEYKQLTDEEKWDFAAPSSSQIIFSSSSTIIFLSSNNGNPFNSGTTYSITAGNTVLDVSTICLAAQYNFLVPYSISTGSSYVMGIDSTATGINGVALYVVEASPANGSYNVQDWLQPSTSTNAVSFVYDYGPNYTSLDFYMCKSGTLDVSGGDMTFNGDYYYLQGLASYTAPNPGANIPIVTGSGTMGCP